MNKKSENIKYFSESESNEIAFRETERMSKVLSPYFKIFFNIYWSDSLTKRSKINNISALIDQLKNDDTLSAQTKGNEPELMEYFVRTLQRKKKLIASIEYGYLNFN